MRGSDRLGPGEGPFWMVLALALVFSAVGALFLARPDWGGAIFGRPAEGEAARFYVRAVAVRDLALSAYLAALLLLAGRRAVAVLLLATVPIPAGDLALLLASGAPAAGHVALHGASGAAFALAGWAVLRSARPPPDQKR